MNDERQISRPARFAAAAVLAMLGCAGPAVASGDASASGAGRAASENPARVASAAERERIGFDLLPESVRRAAERALRLKHADAPAWVAGARRAMDERLPDGEAYPQAYVDEQLRRAREAAARRAMEASRREGLRGVDPKQEDFLSKWDFIGPGNVGGRTRALAISPAPDQDGNDFLLAGGTTGGIFRSVDDGATWEPVLSLGPSISISSIVIGPTGRWCYAGSGEGFTSAEADVFRGAGLWVSSDFGQTWALSTSFDDLTPLGVPETLINKIALGVADSDVIYLATPNGVIRHMDRRNLDDDEDDFEWETLFTSVEPQALLGATDLVVWRENFDFGEPATRDVLLVASTAAGFISAGPQRATRLRISIDGGDTFFNIDSPEPDIDAGDPPLSEVLRRIDTPFAGRMTLALSTEDADPEYVYVLMARNSLFAIGGVPEGAAEIPSGAVIDVFRSRLRRTGDTPPFEIVLDEDDNETVLDVNLAFEPRFEPDPDGTSPNRLLLSDTLLSGVCGGAIVPDLNGRPTSSVIRVDPSDPEIVWVGGVDLWRSEDGGRTFAPASYWYLDPGDAGYVHRDQHDIVFDPEYDGAGNQTMWSASDGGIGRTDNALGPAGQGLCPFLPDTSFAEIGWQVRNTGYATSQLFHGDQTRTLADGTPEVYAAGAIDNGTYAVDAAPGPLPDPSEWERLLGENGGYVQVDHTDNDLLYLTQSGFGNVFRSRFAADIDGNAVFEEPRSIANNLRFGEATFAFPTPLAMDPNDSSVLWTGGRQPWRTTNADSLDPQAVGWRLYDTAPRLGLFITSIAVAPGDSDIVYVGFDNGRMLVTQNASDPDPVWTSLGGGQGLPNAFSDGGIISSIAVEPSDPFTVWLTIGQFNDFVDGVPFGHVFRGSCDPGVNDCTLASSWRFQRLDDDACDLGEDDDPVLPDVPAHWVVVRACEGDRCANGQCTVYVGTEIGVFASDDVAEIDLTGECQDGTSDVDLVSWYLVNVPGSGSGGSSGGSLPTSPVEALSLRDENTLVAYTFGRGAYLATLSDACSLGGDGAEPCGPADLAEPIGVLDQADLTGFVAAFLAGEAAADMPGPNGLGDGLLDLNDVTVFVASFGAGCP